MEKQDESEVAKIDVAYVAHLARLSLSEEEVAVFQGQREHVVDYVRKISALDLSGVEPTSHASGLRNIFRDDVVVDGVEHEAVMANAPATTREQFKVPKILE